MNNSKIKTINIEDYLKSKNISFLKHGKELTTKCVFSDCDLDSGPNENHLYFDCDTSQYHCKKCNAMGNIFTLAKHLGDTGKNVIIGSEKISRKQNPSLTQKDIEKMRNNIPDHIRAYLNDRGITDEMIYENNIGWGKFYGEERIVIPIANVQGKYMYLKLRKDPDKYDNGQKYMFYPKGASSILFGLNKIDRDKKYIIICEGEFDCLILHKHGLNAVTSTAGAGTFKDEWIGMLESFGEVYIAFDNDEPGKKASDAMCERFGKILPHSNIYQINLPERMSDGKDVSDYFNNYSGSADEFLKSLSTWKAGLGPINLSDFEQMSPEMLGMILEKTIKHDFENKVITFLCMLSAYTEESQINISFNAPSSSGKTYIALEVAKYFPYQDILKLSNCSPTAFFHENGAFDAEKNEITIDLQRKIIIFLDQPNQMLLEKLRPFLSHDEKRMVSKITDKNQKGGNRTKTVILIGYPAVIFCSANMHIDEQEGTRFLLLSPENDQEKIKCGIDEKILKEQDSEYYQQRIESDPERKSLTQRIFAVRQAEIRGINIPDIRPITETFIEEKDIFKPRHQRDVGRAIEIIKALALLNFMCRENKDGFILANDQDVKDGLRLWRKINESQEHNLPPYIYGIFKDIIIPAYDEKNHGQIDDISKSGLTRKDIVCAHFKKRGHHLSEWDLRKKILPMLESVGMITQEKSPNDKRNLIIFPVTQAQKK